jgi:hypothetical protein
VACITIARIDAGYIEVLTGERGERVRAEPFEAIPLVVGVLFGDDEEEPAQET